VIYYALTATEKSTRKSMIIYVVQGCCGEYSDRVEWLVCAYAEEHLAKTHVKAADLFTRFHARDPYGVEHMAPQVTNPWDPKGPYDHYATPRYHVEEVELKKTQ